MNATAQSVVNDIIKLHHQAKAQGYNLSKRSDAEALEIGADLCRLETWCLTPQEFSECLDQIGMPPALAQVLMALSSRLCFMSQQICELARIQPLQLVELLALDDYALRRLAAGQEVKGMTLAMLSILRPATIRSQIAQEPDRLGALSTGEELLINHYRMCSRKSKRAIWRAAKLMAMEKP